jgi:hypothetical protein
VGIENRPYVGTWQLGRQEVVQHTPDALVYINGDTTVPGCPKCAGQINLQEFITEVSVDAGTDAGAASASFTLSIPLHHTDSFARDAKFILRPGLEVHIYHRGYFPVKGLYANLAEPSVSDDRILSTTQATDILNERLKEQAALEAEQEQARADEALNQLKDLKNYEDIKDVIEEEQVQKGTETRVTPPTQAEIDARTLELDTTRETQSRNGYIYSVNDDGGSKEQNAYRSELETLADQELTTQEITYDRDRLMAITYSAAIEAGVPPDQLWGILVAESGGNPTGVGTGTEFGMAQMTRFRFEGVQELQGNKSPRSQVHWEHSDMVDPQYAIWTTAYELSRIQSSETPSDGDVVDFWTRGQTLTPAERDAYLRAIGRGRNEIGGAQASGRLDEARQPGDDAPPLSPEGAALNREEIAVDQLLAERQKAAEQAQESAAEKATEEKEKAATPEEAAQVSSEEPPKTIAEELPPYLQADGPSLLAQYGLEGAGVEDVIAYPYYPTFHGVVTQVGHSWSGGVNTVTVQCSSMLHFWQYHTISTNAAVFGARPKNSKLKTSMVGHNFTGMHPYQIIYTLHHDMVGAAGGVGWALSQKTNQTAKSEVAGESLFSLNVRYWKRRFDTEMIKLRLHGASGELYSTAQAAFLGSTSSGKLTKLIKGRFTDPLVARKSDPGLYGIMEQSQAVGLQNNRRLEALRFGTSRPTSKNSTRFELNLVEMQAFVSNTSNWGQIQLFESTYESKLDIAQKVCEVTGFEFYQDVDGDFVFKPPMYNMDTSDSRVYRIEDIDIISINFEEKEPEVTYMTVKGSHGKNIEYGVDNEWGHKGQYIDYRLVAQFGWRPAEYEAAYFNDAKSMFFSAVNRMDIMNAPAKSASVTIPIRPEMRPGYPVYIRYLDCYYYCNSFSHSFSVGGQCTTSLQLIAKRAKFYAPGKVGPAAPEGIEAIDLSNTLLPERPLQVLDSQGRPRLSGFPNVVMALDPDDINDLFFIVGNDLEKIGEPRILRSLLKRAVDMKIVSFDPVRNTYRMKVETGKGSNQQDPKTQWVEFFLQDPELPEQSPIAQDNTKTKKGDTALPTASPVDIVKAAKAYEEKQESATNRVGKIEKQILKVDKQIISAKKKIADLHNADRGAKASVKAKNEKKRQSLNDLINGREKQGKKPAKQGLLDKRAALVAQANKIKAEFDSKLDDADKSGVDHLFTLIKLVGGQFISENSDVADLNSTVNLLDMLSDKKATFSNGSQPGSYRYYSASHPDPEMQGQRIVRYVQQEEGGAGELEKRNPILEPRWQGQQIEGYLRKVTSPYPGAAKPEAQLGIMTPERGIRVLTSDRTRPRGEVLPTSEIRELMFSVQESVVFKKRASAQYVGRAGNWTADTLNGIRKLFTLENIKAPTTSTFLYSATPRSLFTAEWNKIIEVVQKATQAANEQLLLPGDKGKITKNIPPAYPDLLFPSEVRVGRSLVSVDDPFGNFKFKDNPTATVSWGPSGADGQTMAKAANRSGNGLSKELYAQLNRTRKVWFDRLVSAGFDRSGYDEIEPAVRAFLGTFKALTGLAAAGEFSWKKERSRRKRTTFPSPVFPVSDARGYEVIGSYRYGRDVSIEPQNVFQGMHFQDVFSFLDKQTVTNILNAFVRKRGRIQGVPELDKDGKPVLDKKGNPKTLDVRATDTTAQNALEQHLLQQLRENLTNKQILDLFGVDSSESNQLERGLGNFIAEKLKDGIQKVPVINAAYSLADLQRRQSKKVCSCKAAEAEVLLEAFSQEDFVQFTSPGDRIPVGAGSEEMDQATQYLVNLTARASASWASSQDALRGAALDKGGSQVVQTLLGAADALTQGVAEQQEQAKRAVASLAVESVSALESGLEETEASAAAVAASLEERGREL